MRCTIALLLFLVSPLAADDLSDKVKAVIEGADYKHGRWGILIVDAKSGKSVYSRNAETFFAPASVTKLFTCAAALTALGPDYKFETPVYALGKVNEGELSGDLVLVASGDLTFGGRAGKNGKTEFTSNDHIYTDGFSTTTELTDTNPLAAFEEIAKQVKAAGIKSVTGDVLIDDRLFAASEGSGSGPRVVGPMMANDNLIDITISPGGKVGDPAKITLRPETSYLRTDFDVRTVEKGSLTVLKVQDDEMYSLRGEVPIGAKPRIGIIPVRNPRDFARTLLIEALKRAGVSVAAPLVRHSATSELPKGDAYKGLTPVAKFTSAPFAEAITVTLKVSHNLYASALPQIIAAHQQKGRSLFQGLRAEGLMLKQIGVELDGISFGGGAGGANADHVTPRATVDLLQAMRKRKEWETYKAALPVLGVDGTLASVVPPDSPAKGKVFAKTGTLTWSDGVGGRSYLTSKALGGVMTTSNGTELTFAMFVNDVVLPAGVRPAREGRVLGKLCEIVYEHGP